MPDVTFIHKSWSFMSEMLYLIVYPIITHILMCIDLDISDNAELLIEAENN